MTLAFLGERAEEEVEALGEIVRGARAAGRRARAGRGAVAAAAAPARPRRRARGRRGRARGAAGRRRRRPRGGDVVAARAAAVPRARDRRPRAPGRARRAGPAAPARARRLRRHRGDALPLPSQPARRELRGAGAREPRLAGVARSPTARPYRSRHMRRSLVVSIALLLAAPSAAAARHLARLRAAGRAAGRRRCSRPPGFDVTHDVTARRARVARGRRAPSSARLARLFPFRVSCATSSAPRPGRARPTGAGAPRPRRAVAAGCPAAAQSYRYLADYGAELADAGAATPGARARASSCPSARSRAGRSPASRSPPTSTAPTTARPSYVVSGLHHAREWPSGEIALEFALDLVAALQGGRRARSRALLAACASRDPGHQPRRLRGLARGERRGAAPGRSPLHAQELPRRTRARTDVAARADRPCAGSGTGVDPNRNYGAHWGGPGASDDADDAPTAAPGRSPSPRRRRCTSSPSACRSRTTSRCTTSPALVLRPPGTSTTARSAPDEDAPEAARRRQGPRPSATTRSTAGSSTRCTARPRTGTTSPRARSATRSRSGPRTRSACRSSRGPYQTHVIDQYVGGDRAAGRARALREALLLAAEQAARDGRPRDRGRHRARRARAAAAQGVPDARRAASARTARRRDAAGRDVRRRSAAPSCSTTSSTRRRSCRPAGASRWHVNPSTRPYVRRDGGREAWTLTCETPAGQVLESVAVTVDRGQRATLGLGCGEPGRRRRRR